MTDQYRDLPGLVRRLVDDYLSAAKENDDDEKPRQDRVLQWDTLHRSGGGGW